MTWKQSTENCSYFGDKTTVERTHEPLPFIRPEEPGQGLAPSMT